MSYHQFTSDERKCLWELHRKNLSIRKIADALGRAPSSVSRELRRNRSEKGTWHPFPAHKKAKARRRHLRNSSLQTDLELRAYVIDGLNHFWTPEELRDAGRLLILTARSVSPPFTATLSENCFPELNRRPIFAAVASGKLTAMPTSTPFIPTALSLTGLMKLRTGYASEIGKAIPSSERRAKARLSRLLTAVRGSSLATLLPHARPLKLGKPFSMPWKDCLFALFL